jgi:hypothetical protein
MHTAVRAHEDGFMIQEEEQGGDWLDEAHVYVCVFVCVVCMYIYVCVYVYVHIMYICNIYV